MEKPHKTSGQGLVEFALMLPLLMLLVVGALDLGLAFYTKVQLENSAREGAYYMVYHSAEANAVANAKATVQLEAQSSGIPIALSDIVVQCVPNGACPSGGATTVVVTVSHQMAMPVDVFHHGPLHLTNEARMLIP